MFHQSVILEILYHAANRQILIDRPSPTSVLLKGMITYWCKLFDPSGRVVGAEKVMCADDAAVIAKAKTRYAAYRAYEIWDGMRLVQRVDHQTTV